MSIIGEIADATIEGFGLGVGLVVGEKVANNERVQQAVFRAADGARNACGKAYTWFRRKAPMTAPATA